MMVMLLDARDEDRNLVICNTIWADVTTGMTKNSITLPTRIIGFPEDSSGFQLLAVTRCNYHLTGFTQPEKGYI